VPQIILPFGADQFFWAARVAAQGAAPKTSRGAAMNAEKIASMIAFARLDSTRQQAKDLGHAMAREDGVRKAVREIEALAERGCKK
jgi:sterol 3beta-glucosyltransferase